MACANITFNSSLGHWLRLLEITPALEGFLVSLKEENLAIRMESDSESEEGWRKISKYLDEPIGVYW
jgi:hypothetical protein